MSSQMGDVVDKVWEHCVAYPGRAKRDLLTAYFERCQLATTLFFCDQREAEVSSILTGSHGQEGFRAIRRGQSASTSGRPQEAVRGHVARPVRSSGAEARKHVSWYWYAGFQGHSGQHPARLSLLLEGALSLFQVQGRSQRCQARQEVPHGPSQQGAHHSGEVGQEKPAAATNVAISMAGLRALQLNSETLASFPGEFQEGMRARAGELGDIGESAPKNWCEPWLSNEVHLVLMCYSENDDALNSRCMALENWPRAGSTSCNPPRTPASS